MLKSLVDAQTLSSLNDAQVYVFCCAHAEQVKEHLLSAGWTHEGASMDVQVSCQYISALLPSHRVSLLRRRYEKMKATGAQSCYSVR